MAVGTNPACSRLILVRDGGLWVFCTRAHILEGVPSPKIRFQRKKFKHSSLLGPELNNMKWVRVSDVRRQDSLGTLPKMV